MTFLAAYCLALAFALAFIASGALLLSRCTPKSLPPSLLAGAGFFVGMSLFLAALRTAGWLLPFPPALGAALATVAGLGGYALYAHRGSVATWLRDADRAALGTTLALSALLAAYSLLTELPPLDGGLSMMSTFGSLHAARYANLATAIVESASIPVVNQNYGQSLLAAALMQLGLPAPFLALHVWLTLSKVFFLFAAYGYLRHLDLDRVKAAAAAALVYFGGGALSLTYVHLGDSGYPWFSSGYTDTLAAGATLLALALCLAEPYPAGEFSGRKALWALATPAALGLAWQMQAPQNLFVTLPALMVPGLLALRRGDRPGKPVLAVVAVLLAFSAVGILQGGMLTPKSLWTAKPIPGQMLASSDRPTTLLPVYPSVRFSGPNAIFFPGQMNAAPSAHPTTADYLFALESNLWNALRMAFFPLLGFFLAAWLLWRKGVLCADRRAQCPDPELRRFGDLWLCGFLVYAAGFGFAFFISYHGYKWELARFLLPGYLAGMILLALALARLDGSRRRVKALCALIFVVSVGSVLFFHTTSVAGYLKPGADGQTFSERFEGLCTVNGMILR